MRDNKKESPKSVTPNISSLTNCPSRTNLKSVGGINCGVNILIMQPRFAALPLRYERAQLINRAPSESQP
jgi:hypothetical protein